MLLRKLIIIGLIFPSVCFAGQGVVGNLAVTGDVELGHATDTTLSRDSAGVASIEGQEIHTVGGTDVAIADGGTGASTAQAAIDALSAVSGATNEYVLTKDTATGNATWKAPAVGTPDTSAHEAADDPHTAYVNGAFSDTFVPYQVDPVIEIAGGEALTAFGSVVKSGSTYHAYYEYDDGTGDHVIGHATSSDGKTFTKDSGNNPVFSGAGGAQWDGDDVGVPHVWIEGSTWHMYYRGRHDSESKYRMGHATSTDGVTWTRDAAATAGSQCSGTYGSAGAGCVMEVDATTNDWEDGLIGGPDTGHGGLEICSIMKVGSTYYGYYNSFGNLTDTTSAGKARMLGVATATALEGPWARPLTTPVFDSGHFSPGVIKHGSFYYIFLPHKVSENPGPLDYEVELYRSKDPAFPSAEREFLGVAIPSRYSTAQYSFDVPYILTDTINRDTFNGSNGELWMYLSATQEDTNSWETFHWVAVTQAGNWTGHKDANGRRLYGLDKLGVGSSDYDDLSIITATGVAAFSANGTVEVSAASDQVTCDGYTPGGAEACSFNYEIAVGDRITINAETKTVISVDDEWTLTVDSNFAGSATDQTVTVYSSLMRAEASDATPLFLVSDQGNIEFTPTVTSDGTGPVCYEAGSLASTSRLTKCTSALGGGGATAAGTDGQLQYNNGGTAFGGAAGLYYDDVSALTGVGTESPTTQLSVSSDITGGQRGASISQYNNGGQAPIASFIKGRGTEATPLAVSSGTGGDYLGSFLFKGYDGAGTPTLRSVGGFGAKVISGATVTTDTIPNEVYIASGVANSADFFADGYVRIYANSSGQVGVNTTSLATGKEFEAVGDSKFTGTTQTTGAATFDSTVDVTGAVGITGESTHSGGITLPNGTYTGADVDITNTSAANDTPILRIMPDKTSANQPILLDMQPYGTPAYGFNINLGKTDVEADPTNKEVFQIQGVPAGDVFINQKANGTGTRGDFIVKMDGVEKVRVGDDVTVSTNLVVDGGNLELNAANGTNSDMTITNNSTLTDYAFAAFSPSGTGDIGSKIQIIPEGSGYTGGQNFRGQLSIFNSDFNEDIANYEALAIRSMGDKYAINSLYGGVSNLPDEARVPQVWPIAIQMNNADTWVFETDGNLTFKNAALDEASVGLKNGSIANRLAALSAYPETGGTTGNVGSALQVIPAGTGFSDNIKSQVAIFSTDFIADSINYESLTIRAGLDKYSIGTATGGTGTNHPIHFQHTGADRLVIEDDVTLKTSLVFHSDTFANLPATPAAFECQGVNNASNATTCDGGGTTDVICCYLDSTWKPL